METKPSNRSFWLGLIFSLICLAAIFIFIDPRDIWESLRTVHVGYLALMSLGIVLFLVIRAVRWHFMFGRSVPWLPVFHIQNVGYMLNMVLPLRAGDMARAVLIGNVPPATLAGGVSTMVVERLLDMLFVITLLPFTLAAVAGLPQWMREGAQAFGVVAIVGIILLIVAANQRPFARRIATLIFDRLPFLETAVWVRRVDDLLIGLNSLTRLQDGAILLVLSFVVWIPILFAYHVGLLAVGLALPPAFVAFVVCAAALSVALPSSPGQIGVFHAGVIAALQFLGQPQAASASFAFAYHAVNLVTLIVMGVIGLGGIGSTFRSVVESTQRIMRRRTAVSGPENVEQ